MATTAFKFDLTKHENINDNAREDLPVGKHNYVITKIDYVAIKSDKTGKRKHLKIDLRHESGRNYTQFLEITPRSKEDNELLRAKIAGDLFKTILEAAGFKGKVITPAKFKTVYDNTIGIEADSTVSASNKKTYINIKKVVNDGWSDDEVTSADKPEEEEEVEEIEEEEEEEDPAPKKKKKPKKKPAPEPEPEDEDEEEEDEEDEEEEEDDEEENPFG